MNPSSSPPAFVTRLEDLLAVTVMALVWLVPNHQPPWQSFHHELMMGVVLVGALALACWQGRWRWPWTGVGLMLWLCALLPWIQFALGLIPMVGQALVASVYVAGVAAAFTLGVADAQASGRLFRIMAGALVLAAVLNVPVQIIQWYRWYSLDLDSWLLLLVTPLGPGSRPSGMILQPNQLATIQVWGLIGLTWLRWTGHIGKSIFCIGFILIGIGLGLTQSRTGLVELAVVSVLLTWSMRPAGRPKLAIVWLLLLLLLLLWGVNFSLVASWAGVPADVAGGAGGARLTTLDSVRIDGWRAYLAAIAYSPLWGYGIAELGHAYTTMATERPEIFIGQRFVHAHNAILDLMLWVGIPLALLMILALAVWGIARFATVPHHPERVFPLSMLTALAVHAMLELPHHFLYFLAPAAMAAGMLHVTSDRRVVHSAPRWVWLIPAGVGAALVAAIAHDYFPYQERYTEWRFENARVGRPPGIETAPPLVLTQIHDELALYRLRFDDTLTESKLVWINRVAAGVASPAAYRVAATANAHLGHRDKAHEWMMRLNAILTEAEVQVMVEYWKDDQIRLPTLLGLDWPQYQGKYRTSSPLSISPSIPAVPTSD